jgi:rhodanese-related sulfurtransferase
MPVTVFRSLAVLFAVLFFLAGCGRAAVESTATTTADPVAVAVSPGVMSVGDLKGKLDNSEALFLLDVRTPQEYSQDGHVAGSILIPLDELGARTGELPTDELIACICRSGNRSLQACGFLADQGFETINVVGGMNAWKQAGYPIE